MFVIYKPQPFLIVLPFQGVITCAYVLQKLCQYLEYPEEMYWTGENLHISRVK